MQNFTRRQFIAMGAGGFVLLAGGGVLFQIFKDPTPRDLKIKPQDLPTNSANATTLPQSDLAALPLPLWLTKNDEFYNVQYNGIPDVGLGTWSLTIHGLIRQPMRLSLEEIKALPAIDTMHTLECIGNPTGGNLIGNAEWRGISLRDLLSRAGLAANARWVIIGGVDEYFTAIPLTRAMDDHALLAYEMNGEPIPLKHGFPLRAILPGVYGQKQPKWITGIEISAEEKLGPWESQGWSRAAEIRINSAIRNPREGKILARGDILIAGVAHASVAGVESVQVSTDGGATWHDTILTRAPSPHVWTPWGYIWKNPAPGEYILSVRATDKAGATQPPGKFSLLADVFPNGSDTIHSIVVQVKAA